MCLDTLYKKSHEKHREISFFRKTIFFFKRCTIKRGKEICVSYIERLQEVKMTNFLKDM